ncbi:unnamed protein product [Rotaria socialis]|uniref:SH3 domain-containing protein n=2 Tax=Rotaria socialis TaxID=392032 RepID=A0A820FMW8_9BILA|nr:unnamed protein product [Rotaria socialis]CAF3402359.1 unnamed protein product [Rotaria socialis]CAF3544423.1 unnamed protein product [Rotaria socialis]CAF4143694.1 unnamed protein product [Rotaria socialis]CAF4263576.1 unnamed protein product [Rotaria socialis]
MRSTSQEFRWRIGKSNQKPSNVTNGQIEQQTSVSHHDLIESNRQKEERRTPIRLKPQPIYKALALHSFYAQTTRELSFKKGDIIVVLRRINDDWLEGEFQDSVGIFPLNHVELFPIQNNEHEDFLNDYDKEQETLGEAIVKYDFIPQKTFELQLRKGDKVILLRKIDSYWYEGRVNHIEGIFPAAYVETLREPTDILSQKSHENERAQTPERISPDFEQAPKEKMNIIPNLSLPIRKCQVLYDYTPQNPDELEIHVGDTINVLEMCDDGWYCGMMEKSKHPNAMKFGTFPGNYVKLLP